jgi:excisionase family DNA binding protein
MNKIKDVEDCYLKEVEKLLNIQVLYYPNCPSLVSRILKIKEKIYEIIGDRGLNQIQIITTPVGIQEFIDAAVQSAFNRLNLSTGPLPSQEQPVTVKELCSFLGVTEPTIIRWRKKGKIPFMQVGSRVLFQKSVVLKALENKK